MNPFVFVGRSAEDRSHLQSLGSIFAGFVDQIDRDFLFVEEQFDEFFVEVGQAVEHLLTHFLGFVDVSGWNFFLSDLFPVLTIEVEGLHCGQIDDTFEGLTRTDGDLHHDGVGVEFVADLLSDTVGISTGAVHFVDER